MIETDIQITLDRKAVLHHDKTIYRTQEIEKVEKKTKKREIKEFFYEEIEKWMKMDTLDALIQFLQQNQNLFVVFDLPNDRNASFDDIWLVYSSLSSFSLLSRTFWLTSCFRFHLDLKVFESLRAASLRAASLPPPPPSSSSLSGDAPFSPNFVYNYDPHIQQSIDFIPKLGPLHYFIFFFVTNFIF